MTLTSKRIQYLYELMDAAYDAVAISARSEALGHVALIDPNFRAQQELKADWALECARRKSSPCPIPMTFSTTSAPWSNASTPGSRTNSASGSCVCAAPSRSNAISCSASSPSPSIKYSACPRCKKLRVDQLGRAAQASEKSRASQIMQEAHD